MNIYHSTKAMPYVYRLDNTITGEFYIGYRCANKLPSSNDIGFKYFTSSKIIKPRFKEFEITIIAEFFNKDFAFEFEQNMIRENWNNSKLLNKNYNINNKNNFKRIYSLKDRSDQSAKFKLNNPMHHAKYRAKCSQPGILNGMYGKVGVWKGVFGEEHPAYGTIRPEHSIRMSGINNPQYNVAIPTKTCPHCNRIIDVRNYSRYHGEKCKLKYTCNN